MLTATDTLPRSESDRVTRSAAAVPTRISECCQPTAGSRDARPETKLPAGPAGAGAVLRGAVLKLIARPITFRECLVRKGRSAASVVAMQPPQRPTSPRAASPHPHRILGRPLAISTLTNDQVVSAARRQLHRFDPPIGSFCVNLDRKTWGKPAGSRRALWLGSCVCVWLGFECALGGSGRLGG